MASNSSSEDTHTSASGSSSATEEVATVVIGKESDDGAQANSEATAAIGEETHPIEAGGALEIGDIMSERYELLELLGEGGMGRVFLANDLLFALEFKDKNSKVAIKVLSQRFALHKTARLAMQREARKSRELSHPNVVSVHHFDQHDAHAYMIMEYIEGLPLNNWMREHAGEGLSLDKALPLIEGMAQGLDYIHSQRLVHCDFKPDNVFITDENLVKVLDLGIARASEGLGEEREETEFDAGSLGAMTPAYASCEQFESVPPSPSDDVYALACVTYKLLTGKHPFSGTPANQARQQGLKATSIAGLGKRRWQALQRGLAFSQSDRTSSAAEFLKGLQDGPTLRKPLLMVSAFALLAIVAMAVYMRVAIQPLDPNQEWLMTLKPTVATALTEKEKQRMDGWIEQGMAYLSIANDEFAHGNLVSAHHILKGGADNAFWALSRVAERVDSPEARQGLLEIVNSYANWATTLQENRPQEALWMACQGISIHPEHRNLKELATKLIGELDSIQGTINNCASLVKLGSPPSLVGSKIESY